MIGLAPHSGNFSGSGFGNSFTDTAVDADGDTVTMTMTAHSLNGSSWSTSSLRQFGTNGFGVCNRGETCKSPNHTVDNSGRNDFVLMKFDKAVTDASVNLKKFGDTDVSYTHGRGMPDFSSLSAFTTNNGGKSNRLVTLNLGSGSDWILFGAKLGNSDDLFKLTKVNFETPLPPAVLLFGTGLAGLIGLSRRSKGKK